MDKGIETKAKKKNELVRLSIEDIGSDGLGVGKLFRFGEGEAAAEKPFTVFVKDTVIGDRVVARITAVRKTYAYARLEQILQPGADRVEPVCKEARRCGGCQIQCMSYAAQLRYKRKKVQDCLERIGGFQDVAVLPALGMEEPWHYRNKAQYPVGEAPDGHPIAGFYAARTHAIIPQADCAIGAPKDGTILQTVLQHMQRWKIRPYQEETHEGLVRHIMIRTGFHTGQIMVCLVLNGEKLPGEQELAGELTALCGVCSVLINTNTERTNVILGDRTRLLAGTEYIEDRIGEIRCRISVKSFFQVNPVQTGKLYDTIREYAHLTGKETVWDLYCGTGTISLYLAEGAEKVYGVEVVPEAVEDAWRNAHENGIRNASFFTGKAEDVFTEQYRAGNMQADVVVVDTPRKGCEKKLLETILQMSPRRIVYVSCDPATLARDLRILCEEKAYRLEKVQPVDMFPHSLHVETVCLLTHNRRKRAEKA